MVRTHVILDGLQDPRQGQALSQRWAAAGFDNALDVSGQCAWLAPRAANDRAGVQQLTEAQVDRAAAIARAFGLELRDRAGQAFRAQNDLAALRRHVAYEYKCRLATALVFGLPAVGLHAAAPLLAGAGDSAPKLALPWLIELLLVGWLCLAAGWPILWQGVMSLVHLRATADLLTTVLVLGALLPSAWGVLSLLWTHDPWFGVPATGGGPAFHVACVVLTLAVLQRWLLHRRAADIAGRADLMLRGYSGLLVVWLLLAAVVGALGGWRWALACLALWPPMISSGAVHPWTPGWQVTLPVFGFALLVLGPFGPLAQDSPIAAHAMELACGFQLIMVMALAAGWSHWRR